MKLYVSHKKIPELLGLPREAQDLVWDKYYKKSFKNWKTWVAFILFILFQVGTGELKYHLKISFPDIHWRYIYHPITILSWAVGFLVIYQIVIAIARSYMNEDIKEYGTNWIYR